MKKLLMLIVVFALSNCEIKVKDAQAQGHEFYGVYTRERVTIDGMEYMLFYVTDRTSQTGYSIATVNLTKDKLEIELLKKQLNEK